MSKSIITLLCALFLIGAQESISQPRECKVENTYTYVLPPTESETYGMEIAEMRAKLDIIERTFGTILSLQNTTKIDTRNGHSDIDFSSKGLSEVKGEWIQNLSSPRFKIERIDGMTVISCHVHGIIRNLESSPVTFEALLLCNGTSPKFQRNDFHDGDDLYLSFRTPIEGYTAVYLRDEERNAFRLLPYPTSTTGCQKVEADKPYVFFSHDKAPAEIQGHTVAYHLTANSSVEHNFIYILFSPRPFNIPLDHAGTDCIRQLSFEEYEHWAGQLRRRDQSIQVLELPITITK